MSLTQGQVTDRIMSFSVRTKQLQQILQLLILPELKSEAFPTKYVGSDL